MSAVTASPSHYFIGWDVGGWNCDKNRNSRDAIVILNGDCDIVGVPWRGNLRVAINEADTSSSWLKALFTYCQADLTASENIQVTLAIDTPLGFSEAFKRLISQSGFEKHIGSSHTNSYLFRKTERFLFNRGLKPLSAIKDMIGSQATKGMHVIAKFTPVMERCGVWTDGAVMTTIEAYPSACKQSPLFQKLLERYKIGERVDPPEIYWMDSIDHQDKRDALICALVAYAFTFQQDTLAHPPDDIAVNEGWIWVPKDALKPVTAHINLID